MQQDVPLRTVHLFPILNKLLVDLLQSLDKEQWHLQTVAKLWTVKDVAAHLLDTNLRTLSVSRDHFFGEVPGDIHSYADLVAFLNQLNMSWTDAAKRLSPRLITSLLEITGKEYAEHLATLPPFENAVFRVAWAGQEVSPNWFHIAREYTEKFIHQQQIREAVGKEGLMTKELFYPFIDTFMYALPYTFRNTEAPAGTIVSVTVSSDIGGRWSIIKKETGWDFLPGSVIAADAAVDIDPGDAWKLFSKGMTPGEAILKVTISGDKQLGAVALQMVSVMA